MDLEKYRVQGNLTGGGKYDAYRIPYTIQQGDTMPGVASKFGRTYNQIFWGSDNWDTPLQPGQTIYVNYSGNEKGQIPTSLVDTNAAVKPLDAPAPASAATQDIHDYTGTAKDPKLSVIPSLNSASGGTTTGGTVGGSGGNVGAGGGSTGGVMPPSVSLKPGQKGADVQQLQNWLVSQGYMTSAQVATGPGVYGPQTTAALAKWQSDNGVDVGSNPGYFGPKTMAVIGASGGGVSGASSSVSMGLPTTGDPTLDSIQKSIGDLAHSIIDSGYTIPDSLQITPELTQQFLDWAHQAVDPQTKQLIDSKKTDINASLVNMGKQFELSKGQTEQDFGTELATEQNMAGGSGTAFSGLRGLNERNMTATTNRTLESLASNTEANVGSTLRAGGADVGADSASFNVPGLSAGMVSNEGGSRGSTGSGRTLDFNFNPSLYKVGNIPTTQNTAVNNLAGNYLGQYTTLAGANTKRSMRDLIPGITGLPSGYSITRNI